MQLRPTRRRDSEMRRVIALCSAILLTIGVYAQSAVINKAWLEHDVTENGVKGMKIHVNFNAKNMKGKQGKVCVYFQYPKGTGLNDTNGKYCTTDGKVSVSGDFRPGYDNTVYNDFAVFMPINEIHMKKGKLTYYCLIKIYHTPTKSFLTGPTYLTFTGTSQGESNQKHYANNSNRNNNNSGSIQTWREELEYGMFAINKGNPNGARQRTIYRACVACRGSARCGNCFGNGTCTICGGRGGIITAGYGNYIPCAACVQTGRCGVCKGTGKCVCANSEYPGYMPGSTIMVGPDGKVIYNSRDYSGGFSSSASSSRSSSRSSSGGTCSKCGGRRFQSTPYRYAPASASGWMQPYHSYSGDSCPYCNTKTEHYHHPCTECRGYGHN